LAPIPSGLSFEVAAAIPLAGTAALDALDAIAVGTGDSVLIVGSTGGVGSLAIQLAAQRGAHVIATAKAGQDESFVRSMGASETIDYEAEDVSSTVRALAVQVAAGTLRVQIQREVSLAQVHSALLGVPGGQARPGLVTHWSTGSDRRPG
jgi:D-arabinose 1-dehydrogenase-like Zn-dependent alcohol dehydrogenase